MPVCTSATGSPRRSKKACQHFRCAVPNRLKPNIWYVPVFYFGIIVSFVFATENEDAIWEQIEAVEEKSDAIFQRNAALWEKLDEVYNALPDDYDFTNLTKQRLSAAPTL